MSARLKLFATCLALVVALAITALAAHNVLGAFHSFQEIHTQTHSGDPQTVRSWMTVPYISRTYHVPESYLYRSLNLPDSHTYHHSTLHLIAAHERQPESVIIHKVQKAIQTFHQQHPDGRQALSLIWHSMSQIYQQTALSGRILS